MSSLVELICLASSAKNQERCIAGIDRKTGKWVRPVSMMSHGEVPADLRKIAGKEPEILDIIQMWLEDHGETHGFQMENRLIVQRPWKKIGKAKIKDLLKYRCAEHSIFFTGGNHIPYSQIGETPAWRASLQLWETRDLHCWEEGRKWDGSVKWKGSFSVKSGSRLSSTIKDIDFEKKLDSGKAFNPHSLILVSLGLPYKPPDWAEQHCWKLIATVIELND